MKKNKTKNTLLKLNLLFTFYVVLANILAFLFIDAGKNEYTKICFFANGILFFIYLIMLYQKAKEDILELKKEALYVSYPQYIGGFLGFFIVVLLFSSICLFSINPEAANITFIFTFFVSTISMLSPSILMIAFMFFATPAFVIPSINIKKGKSSNIILKILFICFFLFSLFNITNSLIKVGTIQNQKKFKSAKITMKYSTEFLKFKGVGSYTMKLLSRNDVSVPFYHTTETVPHKEQYQAEIFCNSMNASVPDHLEAYHIVFNKFDTFGEKYYWTSDKDGKYPLVLHYKNMSYNIVRKPENITPATYCIAKPNENDRAGRKYFFYRNSQITDKKSIKKENKTFDLEFFKDIAEKEIEQKQQYKEEPQTQQFKIEKKYVNFSVKEVTKDYLQELINKGYYYNPNLTIRKEYEINDLTFNAKVRENTKNIRLCYYPFTEYGDLKINDERQIWQQSFCSPSFELIEQTPALKSRFEKEAYCYAKGGSIPNIPELNGILKTLGKNNTNTKYWTSHKINGSDDVLVYYKDARFLQVQTLKNREVDSAYVYCIKKSKKPSKIVANYKSRFRNVDGRFYAGQKCADCYYYEVPDVILQQ